MDGACLALSIMNAMKSLQYPDMTALSFACYKARAWRNLIKILPSPANYLNGVGSGLMLDDQSDKAITESIIVNAFRVLGDGKDIFSVQAIEIERFCKMDFSNSVAILTHFNGVKSTMYSGEMLVPNHWLCAVGREKNDILLACSYFLHWVREYREQTDPKRGRAYNNSFGMRQKSKIYEDYIYRVTLK